MTERKGDMMFNSADFLFTDGSSLFFIQEPKQKTYRLGSIGKYPTEIKASAQNFETMVQKLKDLAFENGWERVPLSEIYSAAKEPIPKIDYGNSPSDFAKLFEDIMGKKEEKSDG
jgi:hypothetical protein